MILGSDTKRKENARKGKSTTIEEIMIDEGKIDEGRYVELCNVFTYFQNNKKNSITSTRHLT